MHWQYRMLNPTQEIECAWTSPEDECTKRGEQGKPWRAPIFDLVAPIIGGRQYYCSRTAKCIDGQSLNRVFLPRRNLQAEANSCGIGIPWQFGA